MTQFNPNLKEMAKENSNQKNQLESSRNYYESIFSSLGFSFDMLGHFLGLVANSFNSNVEIPEEKKEKEKV